MKKSSVVIIILVLAVLLGGAGVYALVKNNATEGNNASNDIMEKKSDDAMMEDNSMEKTDDAMNKEDDAMEKDDGESMKKDNSVMEKENDAMEKPESSLGSYISYAEYTTNKATHDKGDVVLFFNASWCPTCKALEKDINANLSNIPSATTIVKVDYDNSSELKKKYGVTYQHTLVQVDPSGNQIKKWSGSPTLNELVKEIS